MQHVRSFFPRTPRSRQKKSITQRAKNPNSRSDDDSDSDLELHLLDTQVNELLKEKAASSKLSVKNVKTILKHVITNEAVLKMVRETLRDQGECMGEWDAAHEEGEDDSSVPFYSPKMTRAKLK